MSEPLTQPRRLTPRRLDIIRLSAEGYSSVEIAKALHIGVETVKSHKKMILLMLNAKNTTNAVAIAIREGYI